MSTTSPTDRLPSIEYRLRVRARALREAIADGTASWSSDRDARLMEEAADEIARLRGPGWRQEG